MLVAICLSAKLSITGSSRSGGDAAADQQAYSSSP